jgi:phospholipase/carboxylesterase
MNERFSFELFEEAANPPVSRELRRSEFAPGPLPEDVEENPALPALDAVVPLEESTAIGEDVFVPDHYEPNYAYPLLVWIQTTPWPRGGLERMMRMISDRNYFGVALPVADPERLEEQLAETFARLRRKFHLHTERVHLIGIGEGGTQALQSALSRPAWFGGVAAISSDWPTGSRMLARYDELRGKRVLFALDETDPPEMIAGLQSAGRLLWSAGLQVSTVCTSGGSEPCLALLREINRWVMQGIEQPELVC